MKFEDLIKDPYFDLPLTQSDKNFEEYINDLLATFLTKLNLLDDGGIIINDKAFSDKETVINVQTKIVNGLLKCIRQYLDGFPSKAYNTLDGLFSTEVKSFYYIFKQIHYPQTHNFYRIRIKEEKQNFAYSPLELFHIPFTERGKVTTQRYSIPGFPSLYLGRTIYVCWEELNRPDINSFQAVRFKSKKTIKLLDLSPREESNEVLTHEQFYYIMTWPLIACCSVKVKDYTDTFKPEYIVPQLLLQWIRSNDELDGIRYKSNHIEPSLYKQSGELYNVVLPVKESQSNGHCNKLKDIFDMTEVVSWQLHEFALGGQTFISSGNSPLDKKLPSLELIKGMKYPYSYSALGRLEGYLDAMPTKPIP